MSDAFTKLVTVEGACVVLAMFCRVGQAHVFACAYALVSAGACALIVHPFLL